jgi:hypothetical protein
VVVLGIERKGVETMAREKDRRVGPMAPREGGAEVTGPSEAPEVSEPAATLPIEGQDQSQKAPDEGVKTSYKVQVNFNPLNYWRAREQALRENKDLNVLVQEWIAPHLDKGTYPPRPNWVKRGMELLAEKARKKGAA